MVKPVEVLCAKVLRKEEHDLHWWKMQIEDDSPHEVNALCIGYAPINYHT